MKPGEEANEAWGQEPQNVSINVRHEYHHDGTGFLLGLFLGLLFGAGIMLGVLR